jgi:hypothetical protein
MSDEDAARREEARLLKTMARRSPASAKIVGKSSTVTSSYGTSSGGLTAGTGSSQSRTGANLGRSSSYAPTGTVPVNSSVDTSANVGMKQVDEKDTILVQKGGVGSSRSELGVAPTSGMQKSPSFGSSRNIVTRTASSGPSASVSLPKTSSTVDEEAIRRREAQFDAEREKLRKVELDLIRNGKNALGDMGEINSEAARQDQERLERERLKETKQQKSLAPKASPVAPTPTIIPSKPSPSSSSSNNDTFNANKSLIDDVDALLAQLNQAASQAIPLASSSSKSSGPKENPLFERAKATLRSSKASVPTFVSNAMGATLPADVDSSLAIYIREITGAMKPIQEQSSQVPLNEENFNFSLFASSLDYLLLKIVTDIHLLLDHNSREMVSNYSMELIDKAIMLMQDVHEQSFLLLNPISTASSTAPTPDDIILSSQNKFILFLKHLAQSITTAAKKQIDEMQAKRDKNSALATCVQETALHAQALAQILKQPLFEPQAFKDKLASLVTTIKRAAPLLTPGIQYDQIMDSTRKVLEASLLLQEAHQSGTVKTSSSDGEDDASSPHIQVFHAIGDLLRALLATITK